MAENAVELFGRFVEVSGCQMNGRGGRDSGKTFALAIAGVDYL
jgi:hypothetical protein